jgi:hypothetical protein
VCVCVYVHVCACKSWFLTLKEDHRSRVFEVRVMKISVLEREKVTGGWRQYYVMRHFINKWKVK